MVNDTNFPEYLKRSTQAVSAYNLRSSVVQIPCIPKESGTFGRLTDKAHVEPLQKNNNASNIYFRVFLRKL